MSERKRKLKIGAPRTEVFAMRLDPKLKYLAEIAARKQRRSLANFVEWAIEQALGDVPLNALGDTNGPTITVSDKASQLWSVDEATRLVTLATLYPDLLNYEEQLIWDVICQHSTRIQNTTKRLHFMENGSVDLAAVRGCWDGIKSYAIGTGTKEELDELLDTVGWVHENDLDGRGN
jgi:hypothetical protein